MSGLKRWLACAAAALCVMGADVKGADWAEWRGPKRDGKSTETGLLKEWPEDGPKRAWTAKGIGGGFSTVSVAGGKIYTMGDKGDSAYVHCLDENGGKILWSTKVGKSGNPGGYVGTRSTPTIDGDRLYTLGQHGDLICLSVADGKEVWRKTMKELGGGNTPNWGYAESVLVDGEKVVCTPGGKLGTMAALDKKSGKVLWQSADWTDSAHYSSIVPAEIEGVKQYVQLTSKSVAGIAPDSGKLLWKANRPGETAVIPTPVVHGNHVFVTSGYGVGCDLFEVTKNGESFAVKAVYTKNKEMTNHHGGVIQHGPHIYGHSDNKGWMCLDLVGGKRVWAEKDDRWGKGAVLYADGMLYLRDENTGKMTLIEATPTGFVRKGHFQQPERAKDRAWPHPVIANGKMYLRDQDNLFCYEVK